MGQKVAYNYSTAWLKYHDNTLVKVDGDRHSQVRGLSLVKGHDFSMAHGSCAIDPFQVVLIHPLWVRVTKKINPKAVHKSWKKYV